MSVHDYNLYEARREEILNVARECFAEKGFNATTMVEVARRSGMSVGNLYNYFHGKGAIIESLAEREVKRIAEEVARPMSPRPTNLERLERIRKIVITSLDMKRARVTLEIFSEAVHNEQLRQIIARIDEKMRELLARMHRNYGFKGSDRDLDLFIVADMALIDGLSIRTVAQNRIDRLALAEEIAQRLVGRWDAVGEMKD